MIKGLLNLSKKNTPIRLSAVPTPCRPPPTRLFYRYFYCLHPLHQLLWPEPLSRLASRYGLSEYIFRQLCIRMSIPMPRRQHWNKILAKKAFDIPPLPEITRGEQSFHLTLHSKPAAKLGKLPTSGKTDPLIIAAIDSSRNFNKRRLNNGLAWTEGSLLAIQVSPICLNRACRFMDALLRALNSREYTLTVSSGKIWVGIGEKPIPIVCREKCKRVEVKSSNIG
jgi:hypothetical protein